MGIWKKIKYCCFGPSKNTVGSEPLNEQFRLDEMLDELVDPVEDFLLDEDPTIHEDTLEDAVFDRQMAVREVTKELEKAEEFIKRASVLSLSASKSRSHTKSSLGGSAFSIHSSSTCHSESRTKGLLINDVLADIVKTRKKDEKMRRSTMTRMSRHSMSIKSPTPEPAITLPEVLGEQTRSNMKSA